MNEYVEAKRCMPAQLLAQLSAAKERVMQEVGARDVLDFELEWRPFDEANDLTDTQARAIWREYGFPEGSSIRLRPTPYEGSESWTLLCDSSERCTWSSALQKLLFPSESGGAADPSEVRQRDDFMTEQERIEALLEALEEVSAKRHSGADAIGMIAELALQRDLVAKRTEQLEQVDGVTWLGERGDAIWAHAATMIGFNELAKIQPTLSGKMYCRMLRRAAEEALIALGCGPKLIITTWVLELSTSMPQLEFLPSDIELMRQEVARHDAETGGLAEPLPAPPLAPTHDEPNVGGDCSTYCDICGDEVAEPHSLLACAQELRRQRDHLRDHLGDLEARKLEDLPLPNCAYMAEELFPDRKR